MTIRKLLRPIVRRARPERLHIPARELRRKQRLRELGYVHCMTLYGVAFQNGKLKAKRIEVVSKRPIKQVHNGILYEVVVKQDLHSAGVKAFHERYSMIDWDKIKHKGIPKDSYVLLTWNELKTGSYKVGGGYFVEYDQETPKGRKR